MADDSAATDGAAADLDGLEIIEPGVVQAHRWRPAPGINVDEYEVSCWAGIGRRP